MQVEIKIDSSVTEPKVIVLTSRMTDEVSELVSRLSEPEPQTLAGFCEGTVSILDQDKLLRIYAEGGKVIAAAEDGEYALRLRLYELEPRLRRDFVRISNSEIINQKKAKRFDLSMSGTICVSMSDGSVSYVSRRYVSKIKTVLGL